MSPDVFQLLPLPSRGHQQATPISLDLGSFPCFFFGCTRQLVQQQPPPQAPPMEPEAPDSRKRPLETPPEVVCTKRSNTGGEKGPRFGAGERAGASPFSTALPRKRQVQGLRGGEGRPSLDWKGEGSWGGNRPPSPSRRGPGARELCLR